MDLSPFFTKAPDTLLLNAGSISRTPLAALAAMERHRREAELNPTHSLVSCYDKLWKMQLRLAGFFGADARHLFLRSNITQALQDFLFAVPLPPKAEILVTDWEYGATAEIARERARQSGFTFRSAAFAPDATAGEALIASLRPETRLLVFSHVVTATGLVLPLEKIAAAAAQKGVIVVVDGAHAPGSQELDFKRYGDVDFYGGNLHKWFLGPRGTAFGWVNPRWDGRLDWKFSGWAGRSTPAFYGSYGGGSHAAAQRLPSGTADTSPYYALHEVMDFWEKFGAGKIRARQCELKERCATRAENLGWKRVSLRSGEQTPLVAFESPWPVQDGNALAARIYGEIGVQLAFPRSSSTQLVRFSPGCYATESEIDSAFDRLERFKV